MFYTFYFESRCALHVYTWLSGQYRTRDKRTQNSVLTRLFQTKYTNLQYVKQLIYDWELYIHNFNIIPFILFLLKSNI